MEQCRKLAMLTYFDLELSKRKWRLCRVHDQYFSVRILGMLVHPYLFFCISFPHQDWKFSEWTKTSTNCSDNLHFYHSRYYRLSGCAQFHFNVSAYFIIFYNRMVQRRSLSPNLNQRESILQQDVLWKLNSELFFRKFHAIFVIFLF